MRAEVDTSENKKQNPSVAMMIVQAITARASGDTIETIKRSNKQQRHKQGTQTNDSVKTMNPRGRY
jgi:hypothetical protein